MPPDIRYPALAFILLLTLVVWRSGRRRRPVRKPVWLTVTELMGIKPMARSIGNGLVNLADTMIMRTLIALSNNRPKQVRVRRRDRSIDALIDRRRSAEFPAILAGMKQEGLAIGEDTSIMDFPTAESRAIALMEMADPCVHCGRVECIDNGCLPEWGPKLPSELSKPVPIHMQPGQSIRLVATEAMNRVDRIRKAYEDAEHAYPVPQWSAQEGWQV